MFEYSYMKCLYNKPNFTSKHVSKCIRIASADNLNLKIFSGEFLRTPLMRGGKTPTVVLSPAHAFGASGTPMAFNGSITFQNPTTALQTVVHN